MIWAGFHASAGMMMMLKRVRNTAHTLSFVCFNVVLYYVYVIVFLGYGK